MMRPAYDDGTVRVVHAPPDLADRLAPYLTHVRTLARFRAKLAAAGECLEWTGGADPFGYGKFQVTIFPRPATGPKQIHVRAPRFALAVSLGRWPSGVVLHACDNPRCCNPAHLREGTQAENIADMDARGRRGERPRESFLKGWATRRARAS